MASRAKCFIVLVPILLAVTSCVSETESVPPPPPINASGPITPTASAPAQLTVRDGVFSQAQVDAGALVYENSCKNCHDMRFYNTTLRAWENRPVLDFWYSIIGQMPADNPGSLTDNEYTDVIAYILSESGFPAGNRTMDPNNGMDRINIVSP